MATAKTVKLQFTKERDTPNTVRYTEVVPDDDAAKMRTLYLQKFAVKELGNPDVLTVTIAASLRRRAVNVWLLEEGEFAEGGYVKGVYASLEAGAEAFSTYIRSAYGEPASKEIAYANGSMRFKRDCDWVSLTKRDVAGS